MQCQVLMTDKLQKLNIQLLSVKLYIVLLISLRCILKYFGQKGTRPQANGLKERRLLCDCQIAEL